MTFTSPTCGNFALLRESHEGNAGEVRVAHWNSSAIVIIDNDSMRKGRLTRKLSAFRYVIPVDTTEEFLACRISNVCVMMPLGSEEIRTLSDGLSPEGGAYPVFVYGNFQSNDLNSLLDCDLAGYLDEDASAGAMLDAISGQSARIAALRTKWGRASQIRKLDRLSARERSVADLIFAGASSKYAATTLGISSRTVEVHRSNIIRKLDVKTMAQAMASITKMPGPDPRAM